MGLIDRYLLRTTAGPMVGATVVTLVALLLERVLRLLDLLSDSGERFEFVGQLTMNLIPHYLGLTLPAAFFIALLTVVSRMNRGSEIDALLAAGVSLSRLAAPYVCLGAALTVASLLIFGFLQPYSRYGYRAVLHSAQNAGWSGVVSARTIISPSPDLTITADQADPAGQRLMGVFIRRLTPAGREEITTARVAELHRTADGRSVSLQMQDGAQLRFNARGEPEVLNFRAFTQQLPLNPPSRLLRQRGGDERELTLVELVRQAQNERSVIPRSTLLAELYGRLARALALPFLPLLGLPLGLTSKRGGQAPGMIVGCLLLLAFHHLIQFGQSLAVTGRAPAELAVGVPFLGFAALCCFIFATSRRRPGETPISRMLEAAVAVLARLRPPRRTKA